MQDLEKTKHYTTKAAEICANLISYIPTGAELIEPFVGDGDLLSLFPNNTWKLYDIEEHGNNIVQDTLLTPPDYNNKWIITNPPYLAKNKAKDKQLFNKYNLDDLYKISIFTALDVEGGIYIIPTNFFTDECSKTIRLKFFNKFEVDELNIFTEPVFTTTTYSVCSFAFHKKESPSAQQIIPVNIMPSNQKTNIIIQEEYGYQIAGEFYHKMFQCKTLKFGRLVGSTSQDYITNIKLYAIDTRNSRIRVEYDANHYQGKNSDRTYATFTCEDILTEDQEKILIKEFNSRLENFRKKYHDLSLTNYRDYNRKRIGFTFAYELLTIIYNELINNF